MPCNLRRSPCRYFPGGCSLTLHEGFYNFTSAISAALGEAFVSLSEDPLLVWLYTSVAIIAFCGGVVFYFFFVRPWDSQEEAMNMLKESAYKGHNLGSEAKTLDEEKEAEGTSGLPEPKTIG
jgi:hypothetical protein